MSKSPKKNQQGFTLLELLIVVFIIMVISSVSYSNYDKMGRLIELENAAYNMAITIREAQVYGINKKARDEGTVSYGEDYRYGVYIDRSSSVNDDVPSRARFILYVDRPDDGADNTYFDDAYPNNCTGAEGDECYSQVLLNKGSYISGIYFYGELGWVHEDPGDNKNKVDISFVRPNPDAIILDDEGTPRSAVRIIITDPGGNYLSCVDVGTAGDISIRGRSGCNFPA